MSDYPRNEITINCVLCRKPFKIASYCDGACSHCGQEYWWGDDVYEMRLDEWQLNLLRKHAGLPEVPIVKPEKVILDDKLGWGWWPRKRRYEA